MAKKNPEIEVDVAAAPLATEGEMAASANPPEGSKVDKLTPQGDQPPSLHAPGFVRMQPLPGFGAITIDGVTYETGEDGLVGIPQEHVEIAKSHLLTQG